MYSTVDGVMEAVLRGVGKAEILALDGLETRRR
jgi:hypothetical protein